MDKGPNGLGGRRLESRHGAGKLGQKSTILTGTSGNASQKIAASTHKRGDISQQAGKLSHSTKKACDGSKNSSPKGKSSIAGGDLPRKNTATSGLRGRTTGSVDVRPSQRSETPTPGIGINSYGCASSGPNRPSSPSARANRGAESSGKGEGKRSGLGLALRPSVLPEDDPDRLRMDGTSYPLPRKGEIQFFLAISPQAQPNRANAGLGVVPDHWALFVRSQGRRGDAYQVVGEEGNMRHSHGKDVDIFRTHSRAFRLNPEFTQHHDEVLHTWAHRSPPPQVGHSQHWVCTVLERVQDEGVVTAEELRQVAQLRN